MQKSLKDNTAIVTGAGGGIGRAVAERCARLGMKLILLGGNNREKLRETETLVKEYSFCLTYPGDLTDLEFLSRSVENAIEKCGSLDLLINNAGTAANTPFEKVTPEEFDRIMAINSKVPFFLTQKCLPYLKRSSAAAVINIASVTGHAGYPMQSVYSASKHALLGWTKSAASEYYKENIRFHAISPGGVYTDMVKVTRPDLSPEGMIMPEDIADIVEFILTHRSNAVIDEIMLHRSGKEPFLV